MTAEAIGTGANARAVAADDPLAVLAIPESLGGSSRFTAKRQLRRGHHTVVWLARDAELERDVVLKVALDAGGERAIRREAQALRLLDHPHIAELVSDDSTPNASFVATAFMGAPNLSEIILEHGRASEEWACSAVRQVLMALASAHAVGVVHGDLTPSNCLCAITDPSDPFASPPQVRLIDFGACHFLSEAEPTRPAAGTAATMAPELVGGGAPVVASDLYAAACIAYELVTGLPPFRASTSTELLWQHANAPVRPPRSILQTSPLSPVFERAILRGLEKDPDRRFSSATEFAAALSSAQPVATDLAEPPDARERASGAQGISPDARLLRQKLIARVRAQWIDGVLDRTTDGVIMVRQRLRIIDASSTEADVLATGGLVEAFDRHATLVLLGDAGHGKTISLLRLARTTADRAAERDDAPVPAVFALSAWRGQIKLDDWLTDELVSKYALSRDEARWLLDGGRIVPLLDGLDDLTLRRRLEMAASLNAFRARSPMTRLVVTCRTAEYRELTQGIVEAVALELSGLRTDEVIRQLNAAQQSALVAALGSSERLSSLSATPMLLHLMRVSFRDSPSFRAALDDERTTTTALFDAFVDVTQKQLPLAEADRRALGVRLGALARLLKSSGQTLLFYEDIQPSWLPTRQARAVYAFVSRGLVASLFASSIIPAIAYTPLDNRGLQTSLAFATRLAAFGALTLTTGFGLLALRSRPQSRGSGVLVSLAAGVAIGAATGALLYLSDHHPMAAFMGFETGFVGSMVLGLSRRKRSSAEDDVLAAEEIRWSFRNIRPAYFGALLVATLALIVGFYFGYDPTSSVYMGGAIFFVGLVALGYRAKKPELRLSPNAGIQRTVRNALSAGILGFTAATLLFGLSYGVGYGAFVGLTIGVVMGLWFGGVDAINHLILRLQLHAGRALRFGSMTDFEAAADCGLLRRVGNGYMFMHAMLLDHLAGDVSGNSSGGRR